MNTDYIPKYWEIKPPEQSEYQAAQKHMSQIVHAPDNLGVVGDLAPFIARIQKTQQPSIEQPTLMLFAADHGIANEGIVDAHVPSTRSQFDVIASDNGLVNAIAKANDVAIELIDAGMSESSTLESVKVSTHYHVIDSGCANVLLEPGMTMAQINEAFSKGEALIDTLHQRGCNLVIPTSIGVGSDSSAALLASVLSNIPVDRFVDEDPDGDEMVHYRKRTVLRKASERNADRRGMQQKPLIALAEFGGFDIAMIVGAMLSAAERGMIVMIDGFVTSAAFQVAKAINPNVLYYCVAAQRQHGHAHQVILQKLTATPLLTLGVSHSAGVGGVLSVPLAKSACALFSLSASTHDYAQQPAAAEHLAKSESVAAERAEAKHKDDADQAPETKGTANQAQGKNDQAASKADNASISEEASATDYKPNPLSRSQANLKATRKGRPKR